MKRTLYFLLTLTIGFTACNHEKDRQELPLPVPTASMTRSLDLIANGTRKDTTYTTADKMEASARFTREGTRELPKRFFNLSFNAGPHTNGSEGDFILFQIDSVKLKAGFIGTYHLVAQEEHVLANVRYVYSKRDLSGGVQGSIVEYGLGTNMTASITITQYDSKNNLISGSYRMTANLNHDPTQYAISFDPDKKSILQVAGLFTNVKIKTN